MEGQVKLWAATYLVLSVRKITLSLPGTWRRVLCGGHKQKAEYLGMHQNVATDTSHRITCVYSSFNCGTTQMMKSRKGFNFFFFLVLPFSFKRKYSDPWISQG